MKPRSIVIALIALAVAVGGYLFYKDNEFRRTHGQVTEVSLFNFDQEVDAEKDAKPVLIYFYRQKDGAPVDVEQLKVVKDFAWRTAGDVKVVAVNCSHLENIPLAIAHGALRYPAFVIIYGDDKKSGADGQFTSLDELNRLHDLIEDEAVKKIP